MTEVLVGKEAADLDDGRDTAAVTAVAMIVVQMSKRESEREKRLRVK